MNKSRGEESIKVTGLRNGSATPPKPVPGSGGVKEDKGSRMEGRSAAHYTGPASEKFGG